MGYFEQDHPQGPDIGRRGGPVGFVSRDHLGRHERGRPHPTPEEVVLGFGGGVRSGIRGGIPLGGMSHETRQSKIGDFDVRVGVE